MALTTKRQIHTCGVMLGWDRSQVGQARRTYSTKSAGLKAIGLLRSLGVPTAGTPTAFGAPLWDWHPWLPPFEQPPTVSCPTNSAATTCKHFPRLNLLNKHWQILYLGKQLTHKCVFADNQANTLYSSGFCFKYIKQIIEKEWPVEVKILLQLQVEHGWQ